MESVSRARGLISSGQLSADRAGGIAAGLDPAVGMARGDVFAVAGQRAAESGVGRHLHASGGDFKRRAVDLDYLPGFEDDFGAGGVVDGGLAGGESLDAVGAVAGTDDDAVACPSAERHHNAVAARGRIGGQAERLAVLERLHRLAGKARDLDALHRPRGIDPRDFAAEGAADGGG